MNLWAGVTREDLKRGRRIFFLFESYFKIDFSVNAGYSKEWKNVEKILHLKKYLLWKGSIADSWWQNYCVDYRSKSKQDYKS